ncbi:MAG: SHD1 domain-containing protein [Pirellula sp.]
MSKPFTYWVRLALVATLCTLTTFSPALAGKFIDRLLNRDCPSSNNNCCEIVAPECPGVPTCEMPTNCESTVACAPVVPCVPATPSAPCDGMVDSAAPPAPAATTAPAAVVPSEKTEASAVPAAPVAPAVVETPEAKASVVEEPKPSVPAIQPEQPAPVKPAEIAAPAETPVAPAAPVVETLKVIDSPVAAPATTPIAPALEAPATEAPATEAPAKTDSKKPDIADDLFGESPATTPAIEKPATETPEVNPPAKANESLDDVFGTKPDSVLPGADAPKVAPATTTPPANATGLDSVFGEPETPKADIKPATKDAVDDLFGEPAPTKETPKADAKSDLDDLFGDPAKAAPTEAPAATPPAATAPAATPPAADPSLDDLFGKPVSTEEKPQSTGDGLFDDLFAPKQPASEPAAPVKTPAAPKNNSDELDKLFGIGSFTAPSQFNGAEFKTWVDNTGTYSVKGRLAVIYSDKVKLLKENGKFTTVPLDRLSDRDYEYVRWVASNLSPDKSTKFVKKEAVGPEVESIR